MFLPRILNIFMGFEAATAVKVRSVVAWVIMLCNFVIVKMEALRSSELTTQVYG
jgi:hypothetical protein